MKKLILTILENLADIGTILIKIACYLFFGGITLVAILYVIGYYITQIYPDVCSPYNIIPCRLWFGMWFLSALFCAICIVAKIVMDIIRIWNIGKKESKP